jgi:hypothetical protein
MVNTCFILHVRYSTHSYIVYYSHQAPNQPREDAQAMTLTRAFSITPLKLNPN